MTQTAATSHVQTFRDRADRFTSILGAARDMWDAPTPCEEWTVRDVVAHVVDSQRDFLVRQDLEAGRTPDFAEPADAWRQHLAHADQVLALDGVADRGYDGYFGRTTIGATMANFYGWDLVIHGSDVARSTGQAWSISDEEAASLHASADGWGEALYGDGVCGPAVPVPDDAPATDRLLARLGRDPHWRSVTAARQPASPAGPGHPPIA